MMKNERWEAVINNDESYDGKFYYAVKSTGIFCRPSCKSRQPKEENLEYFNSKEEAIRAGYRPCKRCRPDLMEYKPKVATAENIKQIIDQYFREREQLSEELMKVGVSQHRMAEIFKEQYDLTPSEYADELKIHTAKEQLIYSNDTIIDIGLSLGFESLSGFYSFFAKYTEMTPNGYRTMHKIPLIDKDQLYKVYETSMGKIMIVSDGEAITASRFCNDEELYGKQSSVPIMDKAAVQLEEYFSGSRKEFDVPLAPRGTDFQLTVWKQLRQIPYGETRSYKQVAESIEKPKASRAIGMANNKNPLLIFIPCHRVVGASGELVGYAAGLEIKRCLLELEKMNKII